MRLEHWKYYLALENDLHTIARYVEPTQANYKTFSVELTKLFLNACSEVEVVCQLVCAARSFQIPAEPTMRDLRKALKPKFPGLPKFEARAPRYGLTLFPWKEWAKNTNPKWWGDHNKVKHSRHVHFDFATLENALNAMAGLSVLLQYLYVQERIRGELIGPNRFFEHDGDASYWTTEGKPPPNA
jgi:hypothetical protein